MRITYLHQYFKTPATPGGTRSYELARRLVQAGHEVNMVTTDCDSCSEHRGWYETDESGIRVHWLPVPYSNHMSYRRRIRAFLEFAVRASRKAASLPADVVFATSTPLTIAIPAIHAAKKRRVPMVFEVRDLWPEAPIAVGALKNPLAIALARRLERSAYENARFVVALSSQIERGILACGYPAERIVVIPNGVSILGPVTVPQRDQLPDSLRGRIVITYLGAIGFVKRG